MTKVSPHLTLSLPHLLLTLYPRLGAQSFLQSVLYQHPSWDPFAGPGWDGALPENLLNSAALRFILES